MSSNVPSHLVYTIRGEGHEALSSLLLELVKKGLRWRVDLTSADGVCWTVFVDGESY